MAQSQRSGCSMWFSTLSIQLETSVTSEDNFLWNEEIEVIKKKKSRGGLKDIEHLNTGN